MSARTADLCDAHGEDLQVVQPGFLDYGARRSFSGPMATVRAPGDNSLVRAALEEPGGGRVLVVDGEASMRCALLGDRLAALAARNGWHGVVVNGCVRDADELGRTEVGVKALATTPRKSVKEGRGERDVPLTFGGATFRPGEYLYADADGIVLATTALPALQS